MHTYFYPVIVYGFCEGNSEWLLDSLWLNKNYPKIKIYALDVVKGHLGEACYGITCFLDKVSGEIITNSNDKEKVIEFYNEFIKLYPEKQYKSQLGYYEVLIGDYDLKCHNEYSVDDQEYDDKYDDEYD
jgi:hypothetical protein